MERFMKRHDDRIVGIIAGFDRMVFRGTLMALAYANGMGRYLWKHKVAYKDFGAFAQKLSDRIRAHAERVAQEQGRPYRYLESAKDSKEEIAREIMQEDRIQEGLVCVLSCIEPCQSFSLRGQRAQGLRLVGRERKCLHVYFYYRDREFGLMHVRLQTWLPMTIQIWINGREYLARQLDRAGIGYEQHDNCFTRIDDLPRAQRLLDQLTALNWREVLAALAERANPWLADAELDLPGYYWSVRQGEYATDVMFRDAACLQAIYPALVRHAIDQFHSEEVLRFLGHRTTVRFNGEVRSDLQRRMEGLRIKHWVQENSIKMYNKAGSVLRIETTINNPRRFKVRREATRRNGEAIVGWLPLRKGIADLRRRVEISRGVNVRYLEALAVVGEPQPSHRLLDPVSRRVVTAQQGYRALRPISPEDSRLFAAVLRGELQLQGIRNEDVRPLLGSDLALDPKAQRKAAARTTRHLRLLCAHGLLYRVRGTHYYRVSKKGHEVMSTALRFRETEIALLAA